MAIQVSRTMRDRPYPVLKCSIPWRNHVISSGASLQLVGAKTSVKLKPEVRLPRSGGRLPRSTAAGPGDDTLRNRIKPMEEEGAVGELEEEGDDDRPSIPR